MIHGLTQIVISGAHNLVKVTEEDHKGNKETKCRNQAIVVESEPNTIEWVEDSQSREQTITTVTRGIDLFVDLNPKDCHGRNRRMVYQMFKIHEELSHSTGEYINSMTNSQISIQSLEELRCNSRTDKDVADLFKLKIKTL